MIYLQLACDANGFYGNYYAGMLNHKMIIMRNHNSDLNLYLTNTEKYYRKCLTNSKYPNIFSDLKMFLIDIYNYSIQYNTIFGQTSGMKSIKVYKNLISSLKDQ
jgi:hypothetical protein